LAGEPRSVCRRDEGYTGAGKPPCDWDDAAAREALIDALLSDWLAVLAVLEGRDDPPAPVTQAAALLAAVIGQDTEADDDGRFRTVRRPAPPGAAGRRARARRPATARTPRRSPTCTRR
jgi:hypothetical protein